MPQRGHCYLLALGQSKCLWNLGWQVLSLGQYSLAECDSRRVDGGCALAAGAGLGHLHLFQLEGQFFRRSPLPYPMEALNCWASQG